MRYCLLTLESHTVECVPALFLNPCKDQATLGWGPDVGWNLVSPQGRQVSEPIWFERGDKLYFRILPNVLELLWASVGKVHEQS